MLLFSIYLIYIQYHKCENNAFKSSLVYLNFKYIFQSMSPGPFIFKEKGFSTTHRKNLNFREFPGAHDWIHI